jgi:hypothetical protein
LSAFESVELVLGGFYFVCRRRVHLSQLSQMPARRRNATPASFQILLQVFEQALLFSQISKPVRQPTFFFAQLRQLSIKPFHAGAKLRNPDVAVAINNCLFLLSAVKAKACALQIHALAVKRFIALPAFLAQEGN